MFWTPSYQIIWFQISARCNNVHPGFHSKLQAGWRGWGWGAPLSLVHITHVRWYKPLEVILCLSGERTDINYFTQEVERKGGFQLLWHNVWVWENSKLGQIIWLKKIIQKKFTFVLLFGTRIGLNQVSLFIFHAKRIPFCSQIMSNNVKYCQIMGILRNFWAIFTCFCTIWH